ncbi:MAG: MBL fold metallo-hydrolase [Candidatus Protistobacter heckmanni]|nr:MBL fold metallo-hydrolase [Candidatus Protistobacter heckmanni]
MRIEHFFDSSTSTFSYLVVDEGSGKAAIIDSVLDYDAKSGRTSTAGAERIVARVRELGARLELVLETHMHADHLSAAPWLRERLGGKLAIGERITVVQKVFGKLFNASPGFALDGSWFDRLLHDGDRLELGAIGIEAMHSPGHTPACMTYVLRCGAQTAAFVGDTLFMPDYGTARCDFPGGNALAYVSTVAEQRSANIHIHDGVSEDDFVAMRKQRDATLGMPVLILPSVQVNMRADELPAPESNGICYLKILLDAV